LGYDRDGLNSLVLIALAIITVPQAFVIDLLFSHSEALRIVSGIGHVYAIVWTLALASAMRSEPHVVADGRATFRFPLLQSIDVSLNDIESVKRVESRPCGIARFGLGKSGIIINLRQAVRINRPAFSRPIFQLFVAGDDPRREARKSQRPLA
jgi:hypothetical protein